MEEDSCIESRLFAAAIDFARSAREAMLAASLGLLELSALLSGLFFSFSFIKGISPNILTLCKHPNELNMDFAEKSQKQ